MRWVTSWILRQCVCEGNKSLIGRFPLISPTSKAVNILVMFYIIMNFIMFLYHIYAHSWTALCHLHISLQSSYAWTLISQEPSGPQCIMMEYQPDEPGNSTADPLVWATLNTGNKENLPHELLALLGSVGGLCGLYSVQTHSAESYADAFKSNMLPNKTQHQLVQKMPRFRGLC